MIKPQHTQNSHPGYTLTLALIVLLYITPLHSHAQSQSPTPPPPQITPTNLKHFTQKIKPFLQKYCTSCHGPKKQKADFTLHDIDGNITNGKDIIRWEKILEMISLGDMPPEDKTQPDKITKRQILSWITSELKKINRGLDEAKLALPHQGNRVNHDDLFSGEYQGPAYSPARLWRISPQIYSRFSNDMRIQLSQPLLGLGGKGIQDYASLYADESTIKTMLRNANLIAANMIEGERSRLNFLFKNNPPAQKDIDRAIKDIFNIIFKRSPTPQDTVKYIDGLFQKNLKLGGFKLATRTLIVAMLMSPEFVFRMEIGLGQTLPDGRRKLSPNELAYALSFAFYDKPDPKLISAANSGQLNTNADIKREVLRILNTKDPQKRYWHYPMYHRWGDDYYENNPRLLRFFQEFFDYTAAPDVFKDRERNHDHHANRLRKDADLFVLNILEKDQNVLTQLLTSNQYPIDYFHNDRIADMKKGNKRYLQHLQNKYEEAFDEILESGLYPGLDSRHTSAYIPESKAYDLRRKPGQLITLPKNQRAGMLTHPAWLVAHSGNFDNDPVRRGKWIREHLLADLIPDVPIGVDAKVPEDPHRTLRERFELVKVEQCWRCHKQMNPLGMAFEHYDDFGRYREQIIIGDADQYIKLKRQYDGQKKNLQSEIKKWTKLNAAGRTQKVKEAEERLAKLSPPDKSIENYPAKKNQYDNDLKRWTNEKKKWLETTDEQQQNNIKNLKRRLAELIEPIPTTKPVNAKGILTGTGNPKLDGPFNNAIELAHKLAQSDKVRQSFIRHVFRYWMGRNETLNDAPTLLAADKAYLQSGGSFKALLVSLLTSDSFLYRK